MDKDMNSRKIKETGTLLSKLSLLFGIINLTEVFAGKSIPYVIVFIVMTSMIPILGGAAILRGFRVTSSWSIQRMHNSILSLSYLNLSIALTLALLLPSPLLLSSMHYVGVLLSSIAAAGLGAIALVSILSSWRITGLSVLP